ncbi:Epoxide hydrolase [Meloidogyne graminicola]|uniref:Epoxide hydrolase n=1 Tax=Meloidogyne graminicola TaxID=189291 RepID=A0A8S9ZVP4_9BILA|nr:Epoxide hydrolase [Meloidogyne graminicola]
MNKLFILSIILTIILAIYLSFLFFGTKENLKVPEKGYFGFGEPKPDDEKIKTFNIEFSSEEIIQLKERLKNSRIGHSELEDVNDWSYGIKLNTLKDWSNYWEMNFDFNKSQERLNQFPHYLTQIEGIMIHFLHVKPPKQSSYKQIIPLILVHGWPGNVYEFYKIIPLLTDPKARSLDFNFAFEVIAPSIPGYGFSEQPHKKGFDSIAAARIFNRLMTERLGFKKYLAQGGDWGSLIVSNLGQYYSSNLLAIHLNMAFVNPFDSFKHFILSFIGCYKPHWVFSEPEHFKNFFIKSKGYEFLGESGYMHIQATKPDTIGVGLNDSPIGLLAYILEKFSTWTNPSFRSLPDGGLLRKYSQEDLLTIVSIYWFRGNILSSQRFYKENFSSKNIELSSKYVPIPTGYAAFPHDLGEVAPKELMKLNYNLTHMTIFRDGGHFAALEMPKELANDIFNFAKTI